MTVVWLGVKFYKPFKVTVGECSAPRGSMGGPLPIIYFGFGSTAAWGLFAEADQVQAIFKRHRKRSIRDGTIHRKVRL